jgi:hypothetical protein
MNLQPNDHTAEPAAEPAAARVVITEHAYAYLSGVGVDDAPTIRAGLARVLGVLAAEHDLDGLEADWRAVAAEVLPDGWRLEGETITAPAGTEPSADWPSGARLAAETAPHVWHAVLDVDGGRGVVTTPARARTGRPAAAELDLHAASAERIHEAADAALATPVQGPTGHIAHWERATPWGETAARLRHVAD